MGTGLGKWELVGQAIGSLSGQRMLELGFYPASDAFTEQDRTLDPDPRAAQARCHQKYGEDWVNKRYLKVLKVEREREEEQTERVRPG
uniref:Uncharacterized protein n=1 Tax=Chromera velia CCMP2878 TaxID=1169474 RepID=A0A0G4HWG4_9ALVE|eukprot:Cvel_9039.t1-p1 / transcript=Cvel_9039.t1 / gene=Cvel_9039 / organism=Chromera_velia_CCMP2878 / gene_product=hypothetical protein / transcript_product=hypothetical protein / location=Cvel_scaffold512:42352-42612(-) / protein_length=87 / sequence_SO=supercontig / SO=protein_coding / is_pseudo=false